MLDFPDGRSVRVSHEMIYLELFTPARTALRAGMVLLLVGHCSQPARQAANASQTGAAPNGADQAVRVVACSTSNRSHRARWMGRHPSVLTSFGRRRAALVHMFTG